MLKNKISRNAILYSKNDELELFNDIIMTTNEDTLLCDTLYYFPKDQEYIIASGNMRLSKAEGFLVSDSLYFWSSRDSMIAKGDVQAVNYFVAQKYVFSLFYLK